METGRGLWLFESTAKNPAPHLVNRLWAERVPETDTDLVRYLVVARLEGVEVGGSVLASNWRINTDIFLWQLKGSRLRMEFPQDDKRGEFQVRTWDCRKDAPKPFELCMDLSHGGDLPRALAAVGSVPVVRGRFVAGFVVLAFAGTLEETGRSTSAAPRRCARMPVVETTARRVVGTIPLSRGGRREERAGRHASMLARRVRVLGSRLNDDARSAQSATIVRRPHAVAERSPETSVKVRPYRGPGTAT